MYNPYLVLGLPENASDLDIEKAYSSLSWRMAPDSFPEGSARVQARKCLKVIDAAHAVLKDNKELLSHYLEQCTKAAEAVSMHPRLGQMCVASGMISMEQLDEAVQEQLKSGFPLGEILEDKQFLSHQQLEGLLMGQDLIDVEGEANDPLAQRLIALNLATIDMILIAQMEMKWNRQVSLNEVCVRHGWIAKEVVDALFSIEI